MHRHRELLTSFLASAMLTTSLLPVPASFTSLASVVDPAAARRALSLVMPHAPAGYTAAAADTTPGVVVAPSRASLSAPTAPIRPEKLKALIDKTLATPNAGPVSQKMTEGLGLPNPFMAKNAGFSIETTRYALAVGVTPSDRLIFVTRTPELMRLYATDRDARLISAGTMINGVFTPVPVDQARASFEEILRRWDAVGIDAPPATVASSSNS